ncbi:MAG: hypothetical protein FWE61_10275, partial [Micrococcales bacterium]|nr:hypothetical protein [Micrococcales bacterium]
MIRNPKLADAVSVFTELGWAEATYADAPHLPLGSRAQRKAALDGLRSEDWSGRLRAWGRDDPSVDIDPMMFLLFGIRVGIGAGQAASLLRVGRWMGAKVPHDVLWAIMAGRGPAFARAFVRSAGGSAMSVRLVVHHQLPVPEDPDYLSYWAVYAARAFTGDASLLPDETSVDEDLVRDRFVDHLHARAVTRLRSNTDPADAGERFGQVLGPAVARGWLGRSEAVDLAVTGLDAAGRPSDRRMWMTVLEELRVTDAEILARAHALVPVLATGDALVVGRLAPVLISGAADPQASRPQTGGVPDDVLPDVVAPALTVSTKKALHLVLRALAARVPGETVRETLAPLVTSVDVGHDAALARAVQAVVDAWGLTRADPSETQAAEGLWRIVPPVWTVPRFDHGDQTLEALVQATTELVSRRQSFVVDITVEQFLALANAVARRDLGLARTALAGLNENHVGAGLS